MKKAFAFFLCSVILAGFSFQKFSNNNQKKESKIQSWIRINNVGYLPNSIKVAVLGSKENIQFNEFTVHDSQTNEIVFTS